MLRTTISVCALFGGLLLAGKALQQTSAGEPLSEAKAPVTAGLLAAPAPELGPELGPTATETKCNEPETTSKTEVAPAQSAEPAQSSTETPVTTLDDPTSPQEGSENSGNVPASEEESTAEGAANATELTPEQIELRDRVRTCLKYYYDNPESTSNKSVWGIMHALIAYGVDTQIIAGNRKVNAIGWVCYNGNCNGQRLFYLQNNKLQARIGPGVQGHPGQFLAMLAQSRVKTDFPIKVEGREFTVADLIEMEKLSCDSKTELTFKLIGLAHYLDTDATWTNQAGQEWSLPRLIKEELAQPVIKGACGGTHRMMGFSYAIKKREKEGKPVEGEWLRARKFVDAYHEYTLNLQNTNGSMSTEWFKGRGDWGEAPRRVETTGHILEWLVYSIPQDQLFDAKVVKGIDYLTKLLEGNRTWEIGPKGHALHALMIYDQRAFGGKPGQFAPVIANSKGATK